MNRKQKHRSNNSSSSSSHLIDQALEKLNVEIIRLLELDIEITRQFLSLNEQIEEVKWQRKYGGAVDSSTCSPAIMSTADLDFSDFEPFADYSISRYPNYSTLSVIKVSPDDQASGLERMTKTGHGQLNRFLLHDDSMDDVFQMDDVASQDVNVKSYSSEVEVMITPKDSNVKGRGNDLMVLGHSSNVKVKGNDIHLNVKGRDSQVTQKGNTNDDKIKNSENVKEEQEAKEENTNLKTPLFVGSRSQATYDTRSLNSKKVQSFQVAGKFVLRSQAENTISSNIGSTSQTLNVKSSQITAAKIGKVQTSQSQAGKFVMRSQSGNMLSSKTYNIEKWKAEDRTEDVLKKPITKDATNHKVGQEYRLGLNVSSEKKFTISHETSHL